VLLCFCCWWLYVAVVVLDICDGYGVMMWWAYCYSSFVVSLFYGCGLTVSLVEVVMSWCSCVCVITGCGVMT
jgi:hypothetical protein